MQLTDQLQHLDRVLLSTVTTAFPDPLTDEEKAATNAYLVLAHAVLEEHLEGLFEHHFDRLVQCLVSDMVPLEAVRLAFAIRDWLPKKFDVPYKKRSLYGLLAHAGKKQFLVQIGTNQGIRPENVENLARWVGLEWAEFDTSLNLKLEDLRTLGAKRGEAGHLSPYTDRSISLTRQDYPDNVREWVDGARDAVIAIGKYLDDVVTVQQG